MKKVVLIAAIILVIIFSFIFIRKNISQTSLTTVIINGLELNVEIADTPEKRAKGLSGREKLKENQGMLFIFEKAGIFSFWMKDMNFPIDIIWIDESLKIKEIDEKISPETFPKTFQPSEPILYVLEVNAGWSEKNEIKIGDKMTLE